MPFNKTLVLFFGILTILPGATIKAVNANPTNKNINDIDPECVNYMVTSGGETICLDSASPVEPTTDLDCAPEATSGVEPQSEPVAEVASSTAELEASSEPVTEVESPAEPMAEVTPSPEPATAEESSPERLADAACSPESSVEDLAPSP